MPGRFRSRSWFRTVAGGLLAILLLQSCMTWKRVNRPLEQVVAEARSPRLRVMLADGGVYEIIDPRIAGDSLHAVIDSWNLRFARLVADVQSVEVQRVNVLRTAFATFGVAVLVAITLVGIACSGEQESGLGPCPSP